MAQRVEWHGDEIERQLTEHLKRQVMKAAVIVRNAAVQNVGTGGASGLNVESTRLQNGIREGAGPGQELGAIGEGPIEARVGVQLGEVPYARIHELGGMTAPHVIEAKAGKALAFEWSGNPVTAQPTKKLRKFRAASLGPLKMILRRVMHPGSIIMARPYLRPALYENETKIKELLATPPKGWR